MKKFMKIIMLFSALSILCLVSLAAEPCSHEKGEDYDPDEKPIYSEITAMTHKETIKVYKEVCQEDCGYINRDDFIEEPETLNHESALGTWKEGDVCKDCGYKFGDALPSDKQMVQPTDCTHNDPSKITTKNVGAYPKLIDGNAVNHQLITKTQQYCNNCQKNFGEVNENSAGEEAHSFDGNGQCVCGYVKPEEKCEHKDKSKIEDASKNEKLANDDEYHNFTKREKCTQCNAIINEEETKKEPHTFNGDTCSVCGYVKIIEESELSKAIRFLTENEIMIGDENGNFRPNDAMTRAEYAKIVCNYAGDNINYIYDEKAFSDVPLNHWAYEYISKANQAGLLLGYGDDVFGIEDTLTEEQAITVICRMIGNDVETIEKFAKAAGGYWQGYSTVSEERGIKLENKISERIPASRARVAKWLYQLYNINTSK